MTELPVQKIDAQADDGHRWQLLGVVPRDAHSRLLWLPAMGVAAKHYLPLAQGLAEHGVAVFIHDWRGNGSSSLRPARNSDWGYRELLTLDLPATEAAIAQHGENLPRILGGHSLGGQLACCHLGMAPQSATRLWLVASGSPYWRAFPPRTSWWLPMVYRFLPWLADRRGFLPGRSIGFGGNESRSLIHDWARSALSGRYAARLKVTIEMRGMDGTALMRWSLRRALPVRFKSADVNARGNEVGVEDLHLVHEGLEHEELGT